MRLFHNWLPLTLKKQALRTMRKIKAIKLGNFNSFGVHGIQFSLTLLQC